MNLTKVSLLFIYIQLFLPDGVRFLSDGSSNWIIEVIDLSKKDFIVVTTPTVAGYKIKKVLGMVTGLTPRTRGVGGAFKGAFQSLKGGEVTAFTSEIEKARVQAIERAIEKAKEIGANAIIGMDIETSDIGQTSL